MQQNFSVSPEVWACMSKSQKRAAKRKIAAARTKAAIDAANRRDTEFIARHTGALTGRSKGSDIMAFVATKQQKECLRVLTNCVNSAIVTDPKRIRNAAWNAAQSLASLKQFDQNGIENKDYNTVFVASVKTVNEQSEAAMTLPETQSQKSERVLQAQAARKTAEDLFNGIKHVFDGSLNAVVNSLRSELARIETAINQAKLAIDAAAKSGKKSELAKAEKNLAFQVSRREKTSAEIDRLTGDVLEIAPVQ